MTEMIKAMSEKIAAKIRIANLYIENYSNKRECPFYSEWKGMEQALKTMGIEYEYEYNEECQIIAVIVKGQRTEI